MPKTFPESFVAMCCGPNLGVNDRRCAQVALGQTVEEARETLRDTHANWCHPGVRVAIEVAPPHVAALMLNPPQGVDDRRQHPIQTNW